MTLPAEILDNIFSFLQSDTASLKVCSRSHPILSQLVERHLYAAITIQDVPSDQEEFCNVLRDRPHVANHVRSLEIHLFIQAEPFLEEISLLLPALSMLRRIRLAYVGYEYLKVWQMPEKFRLAFVECIRLPSLMDVCVDDLPFPLSTLSHRKHLRNLSLRGWCHPGGDSLFLPTVDCLTLHRCDPKSILILASSVESLHLSSLKFSDTIMGPSALAFLPKILICCSHSLTTLDVDVGKRYRSRYELESNAALDDGYSIPISLSVLHHLQQLTIRFQIGCHPFWQFGGSRQAFFSAIPAITKVLEPVSSLGRLTLDLHINIDADTRPHIKKGPMFLDIFSSSSIGRVNRFYRSPDQLCRRVGLSKCHPCSVYRTFRLDGVCGEWQAYPYASGCRLSIMCPFQAARVLQMDELLEMCCVRHPRQRKSSLI